MNALPHTLSALAGLLEYPGPDFDARLHQGATLAAAGGPLAPPLAAFCSTLLALEPSAREELYTAAFDVAPPCVLYVSIHLFGEENFKRGEFMAALQLRYQAAGFQPAGELPDHLSALLRFAAQADEAERQELVRYCLLGPVGRMADALGESHPYRALLAAVREALQAAYPGMAAAPSPLEQMRQHGAACASVSAGCNCGTQRIQDGPGDEPAAAVYAGGSLLSPA